MPTNLYHSITMFSNR